MYPFLLHSLSLSIFSSVIGPFGGFFASGFKRAFKIKVRNFYSFWNFFLKSFHFPQDFGDMIPGHGGIMDRFDCQFLMATFVNVYISSFIRTASPQKLLALVSRISLWNAIQKLKKKYFSNRFTLWSQSSNCNFSINSKIISKVEIFWTLVKSIAVNQKEIDRHSFLLKVVDTSDTN